MLPWEFAYSAVRAGQALHKLSGAALADVQLEGQKRDHPRICQGCITSMTPMCSSVRLAVSICACMASAINHLTTLSHQKISTQGAHLAEHVCRDTVGY